MYIVWDSPLRVNSSPVASFSPARPRHFAPLFPPRLSQPHGTPVSLLRPHQYIGGDMRRLMVGVAAVLLFTGIAQAQRRPGDGRPASSPAAGDALAGLTAAQRALFTDGLDDFSEQETVKDGLGPVFNERSCAACHSVPATGGGSRPPSPGFRLGRTASTIR